MHSIPNRIKMSEHSKNVKPLQRLSYSEKIANDNEWGKRNVDYHIEISSFGDSTRSSDRDVQLLYDLYNNKFPDDWFHYVTNPINSSKKEYQNFPARIRPYTIIRPNIDLFLGEYPKRPDNNRVINASPDAYNSFVEYQKKHIVDNLTQHFVNEANAKGVNTGQESQEVPTPEKLVEQLLSTYKDMRAEMGENAKTIIEEEESLKEIFQDLVKDWVIAGESYSYKGVSFSDIDYERISPLDIDYDKSSGEKYVEDAEWVTRRMQLVFSDMIDRWYDKFSNKELSELEGTTGSNSGFRTPQSFINRFSGTNREENRGKVEVIHATWKSKRKIGILSYPDPLTGEIQETEVDENYPVDKLKGETVEWIWGNEWWEGYKAEGNIYFGIGPIAIQRNEMNNFSKCKGPYNGKRFSDTHSQNISIAEMGIPYQVMHIILNYKIEMTLNKHKGAIALIDKNVIPNKPGWDEEKFLYYAEALGYMFIDRSQIGVDKSFNQYQVLNMDLFQHIKQMIELRDSNKREWDEVLGLNPHRKGQTQASDAVSNVQQNIFQSSIISETVYASFDDFIKRELKGLIDISKFAWIDGKKKVWRSDDLRTQILNINPEDYTDSELDIFVTNSGVEADNLKALKGSAQAFAQNKAKPSVVAEVLRAKSFAKVTNILKKLEADEQKLAEKMETNKGELELEKLRIANEYAAIEHTFALDLQEKKYNRENELAKIKGDYQIMSAAVVKEGEDAGTEGILSVDGIEDRNLEREKIYTDQMTKQQELAIKNKDIDNKDKQATQKAEVEKYKADISLKVAKENKMKGEK